MAADIKQKILFQMGSTGTEKAGKSFAKMAAGAAAIGVAVVAAAKGLDNLYDSAIELDRLLKTLSTDMSEFNERTGGMIDTADSFRGAIKLQEAGIKASKEEMAALGVAAAEMNKRLGGGPEGATTQFNKLVKSVVMGTERGLIPFGIELSQTEDKAAASREALAGLAAKFSGMSVEAETAKERMYAFNNSLGTVAAAEFNGFLDAMNGLLFDNQSFLSDATDALGEYEKDIISTKGAISEWMWTQEGFLNRADRWGAWFTANENWIKSSNEAYAEQVRHLTMIADLQNDIQSKRDTEAGRNSIISSVERFRSAKGDRDRKITARKVTDSLGSKLASEMSSGEKKALRDARAVLSSRGGGGGGKRKSIDSMDIDYDETPEGRLELIQASVTARMKEERGSDVDKFVGTLDPLRESLAGLSTKERTRAAGASSGKSAGASAGAAQKKAEEVGRHRTLFNDMLGIENAYQDQSLKYAEQTNERKIELIDATTTASIGSLKNISAATRDAGETGFKVSQALAYSANIVETIRGSMGAYSQVMATVPPPISAVLAPIAAASVAAVGAANGRKIRSQKFGGGGSSAAPSTGGSSFPTGGQLNGSSDEGGNTFNLAVVLNGSTVQQESFRQNQMEKQAGNPHYVMSDG